MVPASGPYSGGRTITIRLSHASTGADVVSVQFNSSTAVIGSQTAMEVIVRSPAVPAGVADGSWVTVYVTSSSGGTISLDHAFFFNQRTSRLVPCS